METKAKKSKINVQGTEITIFSKLSQDYICLTDMVRGFDGGSALIEQWLKNKDTILFLAVWESINNPDFNSLEFEGIKMNAGRNSFFMSAKKWVEATNAKGLIASAGRYGGTYAHRDIAFEFCSWLSPEFKLYLIKEFQRLKEDEGRRSEIGWNLNRELAKLNYRIHTDAIKDYIIPNCITSKQAGIAYANEADVLNVAVFGMTAQQWRTKNPTREGNIRDYASVLQLLVLANLESINAEYIREGLAQSERLKKLNIVAITQLKSLAGNKTAKLLYEAEKI
jgi:hypothetical protein